LDGNVSSPEYDEALRIMSGDSPDLRRSITLLEEAIRQGDCRASYALGTWYLNGMRPLIEKDEEKAFSMIVRAAEAGVSAALYDLAVAYETGSIAKIDKRKAFELFLDASLRGDVQSLYEVARFYEYGIGIKEDKALADIWVKRARELGAKE
jgi:TPR repeat protein